MEYGTGAIFGCPGHDQRDFEFARKYGLGVTPVVLPPGADPASFALGDKAYTDDGTIFNSGFLDGLDVAAAKRRAIEALEAKGQGDRAWSTGGCATGASPASATGAARSRSSIARPAAWCRCRTTSCR